MSIPNTFSGKSGYFSLVNEKQKQKPEITGTVIALILKTIMDNQKITPSH